MLLYSVSPICNVQHPASQILFVHSARATVCPAPRSPWKQQPLTYAEDMAVKSPRDTLVLLVIRYALYDV